MTTKTIEDAETRLRDDTSPSGDIALYNDGAGDVATHDDDLGDIGVHGDLPFHNDAEHSVCELHSDTAPRDAVLRDTLHGDNGHHCESRPRTELQTTDGSRAVLNDDSGEEVLETRDAFGRLVFEFHPATGRAVVHVKGSLEVQSGGEIRLRGRSIALEAERHVAIASPGAAIRLDEDTLGMKARSADFHSEEIALRAGRVEAETREVRFRSERLEQAVGRAVYTAREWLQRVHGLVHMRAGRVRTQARADFTVQAQTANLVARDEVRVQGETIHLG